MSNYLTFEQLIKNLNTNQSPQSQINEICTFIVAMKAEPEYQDSNNELTTRSFNKNHYHAIKDALSYDTKIQLFIAISQKDYTLFNQYPQILGSGLMQYFINIQEKSIESFTQEEFKQCFASLPKIASPFFQSFYTKYLKNPGIKKEVGRALLERIIETKSFGEGEVYYKNMNSLMAMTANEVNSKHKLNLVFTLFKEVGLEFEKYPLFIFKTKPLKKEILKYVLENDFNYVLQNEGPMTGLFMDYFNQNNVEQCKIFLDFLSADSLKNILGKLEKFSEKKIIHNNGYTLLSHSNPIQKEKLTLISYIESLYLSKTIEDKEKTETKRLKI